MRRNQVNRMMRTKRLGAAAAMLLLLAGVSLAQDKDKQDKDKKASPSLAISKAFKLSGWTQFQYVNWKTGVDNFAIRRSRLSLSGDILQNLHYKLQMEIAKTPTLLDASIDYEFSKALSSGPGNSWSRSAWRT